MSVLGTFGIVLAAIALLFTIVWIISIPLRDVSIIDLFWGLGFVIVAWIGYVLGEPQPIHLLLALLTTVWGLRLSGYLAWRNLGHGEDKRYAQMRERIGPRFWWFSWFYVFAVQMVVMWFVSWPLQLAPRGDVAVGWLAGAGVVVWLVGFVFESVGDWQLARFLANPDNRGQVMDRGLWRYTRHPNYFGDFTVWWGLYLVALAGGAPWWTVVGPIVMSVFLLRVSGVTLLERSLKKRRPGYEAYIRRTSSFFPLPPKRA